MDIEHRVSLKKYNTFGIDVPASHFIRIDSLETLREALAEPGLPPPFILSGGSNLLLTGPLEARVLYMDTRGREVVAEDAGRINLRVMAGENWHELVMWTLDQGFGGLENLALIPGKTGTAPIQNIGAYGVEIKDVLQSLEAVDMQTGELVSFSREACGFGYRDSVFKRGARGRYVIWSVTLGLTRKGHEIRTGYGDIAGWLEREGIRHPEPADVARAVIAIRKSKLPDPAVLGNSGSFFKNPVVPKTQYEELLRTHPGMPGYPQEGDGIKVPAGWLIDSLGLKGMRRGDAGVHEKQALVLVNHGAATGEEILQLAREIQQRVLEAFDIRIEPEVNIL
ncbi:UDP-N-acetylmuramate dehydrogenase [Robiginitalea sp. SC105]|uniref:UDP-N-acetylmuramate dehydrogenase n=1 Tax=Robiginitalea sp. SC105 TaxID=2762332 RepID=UPI00163A108D|nr:UDP-N-acetylmuramate dehydrogenase [Robiginitalea sp. SC105]MBC2839079.1 UDP-N-acetylmuramate dehydrogenase [Robiginitalea sp. SC105]